MEQESWCQKRKMNQRDSFHDELKQISCLLSFFVVSKSFFGMNLNSLLYSQTHDWFLVRYQIQEVLKQFLRELKDQMNMSFCGRTFCKQLQ